MTLSKQDRITETIPGYKCKSTSMYVCVDKSVIFERLSGTPMRVVNNFLNI